MRRSSEPYYAGEYVLPTRDDPVDPSRVDDVLYAGRKHGRVEMDGPPTEPTQFPPGLPKYIYHTAKSDGSGY